MECWETVLIDTLHATRSLLCIATDVTPHELFLRFFCRKSPSGKSLPAWLMRPGPVFLRKHVRTSKHDDLAEEVELLEANPTHASVRQEDGRELNLSLSDAAPCTQIRAPNEALPTKRVLHPSPTSDVSGGKGETETPERQRATVI